MKFSEAEGYENAVAAATGWLLVARMATVPAAPRSRPSATPAAPARRESGQESTYPQQRFLKVHRPVERHTVGRHPRAGQPAPAGVVAEPAPGVGIMGRALAERPAASADARESPEPAGRQVDLEGRAPRGGDAVLVRKSPDEGTKHHRQVVGLVVLDPVHSLPNLHPVHPTFGQVLIVPCDLSAGSRRPSRA